MRNAPHRDSGTSLRGQSSELIAVYPITVSQHQKKAGQPSRAARFEDHRD
jgi:hypothetical protein